MSENMHHSRALTAPLEREVERKKKPLNRSTTVGHITGRSSTGSKVFDQGLSYSFTRLVNRSDRELAWVSNFYLVIVGFALNRGGAAGVFEFAGPLLGGNVVRVGGAILNLTQVFGSFAGGALVKKFGAKRSMLYGFILLCVFYAAFASATFFPKGDIMQWPTFLIAAVSGGWGVVYIQTALGPYITKTADVISEEQGEQSPEEMSEHLTGTYAMIVLFFDFALRLLMAGSFALLPDDFGHHHKATVIMSAYTAFGLVTILMQLMTRELPSSTQQPEGELEKRLSGFAAMRLVAADPVIWLISVLTITVGFIESFNSATVTTALGEAHGEGKVPLLMSAGFAVGMLLSKVYSLLSLYIGPGVELTLGVVNCLVFGLVPVVTSLEDLSLMGYLLLYINYGSLQSVSEGVLRSIYAEYFRGERVEAAFAMYTTTKGLSGAIFLITGLFVKPARNAVGWNLSSILITAGAALTLPAYIAAKTIYKNRLLLEQADSTSGEEDEDSQSDDDP